MIIMRVCLVEKVVVGVVVFRQEFVSAFYPHYYVQEKAAFCAGEFY